MAGDWIKIEHTTPDKPEVVAIADALGMELDSVTGKLLRIWIWADQNSVDGNDLSVTDSFLDRLTRKRGFAAAMRKVGWLFGENGCLIFPGFERHNGRPAKERAETNRRVAKHRKGNKKVTQEPLQKPLPEKSIEKRASSKEDAVGGDAAADGLDLEDLAGKLCKAHPARALTRPALQAALAALRKHPFEKILEGTKAYADAVASWTPAERLQFVKNPEAFFREDIWNQPAENWGSRIKGRQAVAVVNLEEARKSLGRRAAHIL